MDQLGNHLRAIALASVALSLLSLNSYAQKIGAAPPASKCSVSKDSAEGWKRFYLEGPNGDAVCAYLPHEPQHFPGGRFRGGDDVSLSADVYLLAEKGETYAVAFVSDMPGDVGQLSDEQKSDILYGSWRAIAESVRQALQRGGGEVEVKAAAQTKVNVNGHEGRVQLFMVGQYQGQARILFVDKRAYLMMGVWPKEKAEKSSDAFFDSFEVRHQTNGSQ